MPVQPTGMNTQSPPRGPRRHDRPFHLEKAVYCDNSIATALTNGQLTADDTTLIRDFVIELKATTGISVGRGNKIAFTLVKWRQYIGPYRTLTLPEIYRALETIRSTASRKGRPYKQNTQRDFIAFLKRFVLWLIGNNILEIDKEKVGKIRLPRWDLMTKTASQMLTEEEVSRMIQACMNSRDRALIAVLYEGGFRLRELGTLTWSQVKFDDYGAVVNVNCKTEKPRFVRLVASVPYLASWRHDSSGGPNGGCPRVPHVPADAVPDESGILH
jgi:integrase/recombinase XerD